MADRSKIAELFEQDQSWRERAQRDIEAYRKGDACITVTDETGAPVPGAKITAVQKTHEFRFGANLFMLDELESEEKNAIYKEKFAELLNMATLPFYWNTLEPEEGKPRYAADSPKIYRRPAPDLCIQYCEEHGIEPREHALAYDSFFPDWLVGAPTERVKAALEKRMQEVAERYADKIRTIEVTNEMCWQTWRTDFYDEPDFIEWCFRTARKYFPNNELGINEAHCQIWNGAGRVTDQYYSYIEINLLRGAPIDAIGMQFHMFYPAENEYVETRPFYNPKRLYRIMDLYARFGKPLQVTELTIPAYSEAAEDEDLQAKLIEYLYTIWFSHPNMEQIIYWNLVDGYAHVPDPNPEAVRSSQGNMTLGENVYYGGLMRFDMTPKPAYYTLKNLIHNVWHTEAAAESDASGAASFRGFYGKYEVTVEANGVTKTVEIDLSAKGGKDFTVVC